MEQAHLQATGEANSLSIEDEELKTNELTQQKSKGGIHTNDEGSVSQYFKFYSKL